ncbi:sigma-70 family RNA polymerase sigma factor [Kitasatospora sp. NPDC051853]|uniref:sigma-70 family RNA polymerase sigma factor n=1 Tax=Kitasatospora sp. NPDC051853 TaxID=3364058 RepID=UPI0037876302
MDEEIVLAERFEAERPALRAVAYRMLGSLAEAEDAVQEAWLRLSRAEVGEVRNLAAWLTTVVGRVCLDQLRSRRARPEDATDFRLPDPVVSALDHADPEGEALLADSVGLAMLVVLDTLPPAERVAFVLHDMFQVPFDTVALIVDREPAAARQLASRARRRVRGATPPQEPDRGLQRVVVEAFRNAARDGDFDALLEVLDPEVLLRVDSGPGVSQLLRGARLVAAQAARFAGLAPFGRLVLVNGSVGSLVEPDGRPYSLMAFTVRDGRITEIAILADRERLARLDLPPAA